VSKCLQCAVQTGRYGNDGILKLNILGITGIAPGIRDGHVPGQVVQGNVHHLALNRGSLLGKEFDEAYA
jgi:hypothetical protein